MTNGSLRFIPWFWSVGAGLALSVMGADAASAAMKLRDVTVAHVVDGDTVHTVDSRNQLIKIRMQGIDAPESHLVTEHGVAGQLPWGKDSSNSLASLARKGDRGVLEDYGTDKYGRTLGHVVLNGTNLNIEQVRKGQAISYIICDPGNCSEESLEEQHASEIIEACRYAQSKGAGLFNRANPLKEMPFEFRLRLQNRKPEKFVGNVVTKEYVSPENYYEIPICDRIFFMKEADARKLGYTKR